MVLFSPPLSIIANSCCVNDCTIILPPWVFWCWHVDALQGASWDLKSSLRFDMTNWDRYSHCVAEESESLNLRLQFFGLWQIKRFNNTLMASKIINQTCRAAKKNKGRWICTKNTLFGIICLMCCTCVGAAGDMFYNSLELNRKRRSLLAGGKQIRAPSKYRSGWGGESHRSSEPLTRCDAEEDETLPQFTKKGKRWSWYFPLLCDKPRHRHKSQLTERIKILYWNPASHLVPRNTLIVIAELRRRKQNYSLLLYSGGWWGGRKWGFFNGNKSVYVVGWSPSQRMMMAIISLIRILNVIASCALQTPQKLPARKIWQWVPERWRTRFEWHGTGFSWAL